MTESFSASILLREAAQFYDSPKTDLRASARKAWRGGFTSGGEWMREALWVMRNGNVVYRELDFAGLGYVKYSLATLGAVIGAIAGFYLHQPLLLIAGVLLFYLIEAQMVFLFPLAIDGERDLLVRSRLLINRAGGTWKVIRVVMTLAASMIFGGFCGRGFIRSWCLGCLAVLVWYERLRVVDEPIPAESRRNKLEIGNSQPLVTRRERFSFLGNSEAVRIAYISDLHFARNPRSLADAILAAVEQESPDLILLGGDLVDSKAALPVLQAVVRKLSDIAQVWAIPGNHDEWIGAVGVQEAVEKGGGNWLGEDSVVLRLPGSRTICLDGTVQKYVSNARGRILCAHDPSVFPQAVARGYSLVLAGHLHGGQFVFEEYKGRLFPGAVLYRWNGLRFQEGASVMLVSRGVSDTLPIRWNCPREILLCEIF